MQGRFARPGARGALVVVTHDRWFLDAVCSRMWEVRGDGSGQVEGYEGGYAAYVLARAERARTAAVAAEKRDNLLRKELAWLRRGAPARTSKPKFRLDAAAALIADVPPPRDSLELTRTATKRLGKDVLDLEDVTVTVPARGESDAPRVLLDDITWRLGPGDRYGVVGVNGAGKTTLLALLAGRREPDAGRVKRGKTVHVAELSQDVGELDDIAGRRVVQVIEDEKRSVVVDGKELTASQLVERLGFTRERAQTLVRDLSGGERRRLQLLRLLVAEPNVLLLDEPTNDLDTDTLAALEDLLDGWPGTLVVVSHDRYLLERVADRQVALLGDGQVRDLPGGVEQYLDLRRAAIATGGTSSGTSSGNSAGTAAARTADAHGAAATPPRRTAGRRPAPPRSAPPRRRSTASSAGSRRSRTPRPGCTSGSPRRRRTSPPWRSSTASCARWRRRRTSSRRPGSRRRRSRDDGRPDARRAVRARRRGRRRRGRGARALGRRRPRDRVRARHGPLRVVRPRERAQRRGRRRRPRVGRDGRRAARARGRRGRRPAGRAGRAGARRPRAGRRRTGAAPLTRRHASAGAQRDARSRPVRTSPTAVMTARPPSTTATGAVQVPVAVCSAPAAVGARAANE
ncbi:ABC-F family ATP-binding cassette domain-containing protein [Cellulosimicrobium sp. CUA-896]|uniref:ABC-F family ATP-binding cassette domain-containing protein n=1 Tax=Cellulosimicrobium sp. CUA-896 TaxID=1517881 RepID=UPI003513B2B9